MEIYDNAINNVGKSDSLKLNMQELSGSQLTLKYLAYLLSP